MGTKADATTNEHGCWPNAGVKIDRDRVIITYRPSEHVPDSSIAIDRETARRLGGILTTLPDEMIE